jgi:alpha-1,2-mannosyltransferase
MRSPFHYGLFSERENLVLCAVVMALSIYAAHRLWRRGQRFSSTMMIIIAGAIGSPVAWDHYFAFAPLLVLVAYEAGWHTVLGRTALAATVLSIFPWFLFRTPLNNDWWASTYAFVARNALLLSTLAVVVAAVVGHRARHRAPRRRLAGTAPGAPAP